MTRILAPSTPCEPAPPGIYTHEAGVSPAHQRTALSSSHDDFTSRFITRDTRRARWPRSTGPQPSPPSMQKRNSPLRRRTADPSVSPASIADGIPVSLSEAITGLDHRNLSHLLAAIRHASGERPHEMH